MDTFALISGKPKRTILLKCLCLHINLSGIRLLSDNGERNMTIVCLYKKNSHAVKLIPYTILAGNGLTNHVWVCGIVLFFRAYSSIKMAALVSDKLRHFPTSPLQQLYGVCRSNFIDTKQIFNVFFILQVVLFFGAVRQQGWPPFLLID